MISDLTKVLLILFSTALFAQQIETGQNRVEFPNQDHAPGIMELMPKGKGIYTTYLKGKGCPNYQVKFKWKVKDSTFTKSKKREVLRRNCDQDFGLPRKVKNSNEKITLTNNRYFRTTTGRKKVIQIIYVKLNSFEINEFKRKGSWNWEVKGPFLILD